MAEFASADVPDEGKGPAAGGGGSAGGEAAEDSYPLTVVYCGGEESFESVRLPLALWFEVTLLCAS